MAKYYILAIILIAILVATVWKPSYAFFNDEANSQANTFTAATEFPSITPSPTGDEEAGGIVINEVFQSSTNNAEWIELYNSSNTPIDVSGWKIKDGLGEDSLPQTPPIPTNGYAVIIVSTTSVTGIPTSAVTIQLGDSFIGSGLNVAGDIVRLTQADNADVDVMSFGDNESIFSLPNPSAGQSLRRIPNGTDTDTASDWAVGATSIGVSN